jgi:hypothetical protein
MFSEKTFLYVFVDESGDLGKHGSNFFVIACLSTTNVKPLGRIIKKIRQRRLKKKLRELPEIKANSSTPKIRKEILRKVAACDCKIDIIVIDKKQIKEYLYEAKSKLYNYLFGLLIEDMDLQKSHLEIIIDKKDSNYLIREDLNQYIYKKIAYNHSCNHINIKHEASHNNQALQIVDFIAWAVYRKFSYKDETYYKIINQKIGTLKQLWKK